MEGASGELSFRCLRAPMDAGASVGSRGHVHGHASVFVRCCMLHTTYSHHIHTAQVTHIACIFHISHLRIRDLFPWDSARARGRMEREYHIYVVHIHTHFLSFPKFLGCEAAAWFRRKRLMVKSGGAILAHLQPFWLWVASQASRHNFGSDSTGSGNRSFFCFRTPCLWLSFLVAEGNKVSLHPYTYTYTHNNFCAPACLSMVGFTPRLGVCLRQHKSAWLRPCGSRRSDSAVGLHTLKFHNDSMTNGRWSTW